VGFNLAVAVCQESAAILDRHPGVGPLVRAYRGTADRLALPATPEQAGVVYLLHLAHTDALAEAVQAALARDLLSALAGGGVFLDATPIPMFKHLLETMGWERVPGASNRFWSDALPADGYVLDLRRIGVEAWIEGLVRNGPPTTPLAQNGPAAPPPPRALDDHARPEAR
jgi:hypothetical protein